MKTLGVLAALINALLGALLAVLGVGAMVTPGGGMPFLLSGVFLLASGLAAVRGVGVKTQGGTRGATSQAHRRQVATQLESGDEESSLKDQQRLGFVRSGPALVLLGGVLLVGSSLFLVGTHGGSPRFDWPILLDYILEPRQVFFLAGILGVAAGLLGLTWRPSMASLTLFYIPFVLALTTFEIGQSRGRFADYGLAPQISVELYLAAAAEVLLTVGGVIAVRRKRLGP